MTEKILYHYTTMNTFYAMMEHSLCYEGEDYHPKYLTMWATHYAHQNDPIECKLFLNGLQKAVKNYTKKHNIVLSSEDEQLLYEPWYGMGIYTVSFSEQEDSLTMWRGYGQNGDGISLGFDFSKLPQPPMSLLVMNESIEDVPEIDNTILRQKDRPSKCIYVKPNDLFIPKETISSTIDNLLQKEKKWRDIIQIGIRDNYAPLFKHYKYEQEKEWRIVRRGVMPKYRIVNDRDMIPYLEVKISIDCLRRIVIGPCISSKENVMNIKKYLLTKFIDVDVIESEIPYRNRF